MSEYIAKNQDKTHDFILLKNIIKKIFKSRNETIFKVIKKNQIKHFSISAYNDYSTFILKRKFKECKFNFNIISSKRLKLEHDELFSAITLKEAKKLKLIKYDFNKKYKLLIQFLEKSNLDLEVIKTNRELLQLAQFMKNCVYQYNTTISESRCIVLKGIYKEEEHCILIYNAKKGFKLYEIKRRFNKKSNKNFALEIKELLINFNNLK